MIAMTQHAWRLPPTATDADGRRLGHRHEKGIAADDWAGYALTEAQRRNAVWFCQLRWGAAAVLMLVAAASWQPAWLASWGLRLQPEWPTATAIVLVSFNLICMALLPKKSHRSNAASIRAILWLQIVADLVVLTGVIHCVGSVETHALFVYLFHIILACIFFRRLQSLAITVGAAALYLTCLMLEFTGWLTPRTVFAASFALERTALPAEYWTLQTSSALLIWGGIWYLASRQAAVLRQRERELDLANSRLRASMEERSRHMLQTTHQLKAPFAAIHANAQLLLGGYCGSLPEPATTVVNKISARCSVLSQQIVEMLQLANLRSAAQQRPVAEPIALHTLLASVVAQLEPIAAQRGITIRAELPECFVAIGEDHLQMLLENLVHNAVNYSYDGGVVRVRATQNEEGIVRVIVQDDGIGIAPEAISRIFDDYFRTNTATAHHTGSTGLGLSIVRQVARMWDIQVDVRTAVGQGTEFTLTFPRTQDGPPGVDR